MKQYSLLLISWLSFSVVGMAQTSSPISYAPTTSASTAVFGPNSATGVSTT